MEKIKFLYNKIFDYFATEEGLILISLFPLYFSWLPVLYKNDKNEKIRSACLHSMILSIGFLLGSFIVFILSGIPWIGTYLAILLHVFLILSYLGISSFLIYLGLKGKKIAFALFEPYVQRLEDIFSAHSSTG